MSTTETADKIKPVHAKPSGWTDGGIVWHPRESARGGQRFKCKTCGRTGSGYGREARDHSDECSTMAGERARLATVAAEKAIVTEAARAKLYATNWTEMPDELVRRLAALLP